MREGVLEFAARGGCVGIVRYLHEEHIISTLPDSSYAAVGGEQNELVHACTSDHVDPVRYLVEERKVPLTPAFLYYYQSYFDFDQVRPYTEDADYIQRIDEIFVTIYDKAGITDQDELSAAQHDLPDY